MQNAIVSPIDEKHIGYLVGKSLRMSRAPNGPWGMMKPDSILDRLANNPHPLLLTIHDYTEHHIDVEYIPDPSMLFLHSHERYKGQTSWFGITSKGYINSRTIEFYERQIRDVVDYLHGLSLIHGDLQVNNVVLSGAIPVIPYIKLIDFGSMIDMNTPLIEHDSEYRNVGVTSMTEESEDRWMEHMIKEWRTWGK